MRRGGRWAGCGAAGAFLLLLVAGSAKAAEVFVYPEYDDGRSYDPPRVKVQGDDTRDRITVGYRESAGAFRIRDNQGVEIGYAPPSDSCTRVDPNEILCTSSPIHTRLDLFGGGGRDRIRVGRTVPVGSYIGGGHGKDVLVGGWHRDKIEGGRGPDLERGRRGRDLLGNIGDPGHDDFRAGRGKDAIYAIDGLHDHKIGCGRGRDDYASFDAHLDPRPVNCEQAAGY